MTQPVAAAAAPAPVTTIPWLLLGLTLMALLALLVFGQHRRRALLGHLARTGQRLRRREAQLRGIFEQAPDPVLVCNAAGRIVLVNQQVEALLGYQRQELLRRPVEQLIPVPHRQRHVQQRERFMAEPSPRAMGGGRELTALTKSGQEIPVDIRLAQIEHRGRHHVVAAIRDLRERQGAERRQERLSAQVRERTEALRRSREELQAILDNSPTLIHVKDRAGRYTLVNDRWCELARLSADAVLGRSDEMLFPPEAAGSMAQYDEVVLDQGEPRQFEEVRTLGNARVVLDTYKFPLLDDAGRTYGLCGISHDITEARQNEEDLRRARDQAQEASRAKTVFLANMSHEIRTPINAIIGMTHLALGAELPPRPHDYVHKAHQAANDLLTIVNDLLDFARIEAGHLDLETAPFRLEDVLDSFTATIGPRATRKGLELLLECPPDLPTALVGDPVRLSQVLINLGKNAVKFTEQGEVVLRVRVAEDSTEQVLLRFSMTDTGIGLSETERGQLFEPFHQADASSTRRFGGTGLGLAICRRLMELMGGRVWVESEPGVGSTFHATARFGRQQAVTGEAPSTLPADERVLVVDDNAIARGILAMIVESLGLRAGTAADGDAALETLREASAAGDPYRVVFLDWRMPGRDGAAVARTLLADSGIDPKPRLIVVTAYGEDDAGDTFAGLDIHSCLAKPVSAAAVREAVARAPAPSAPGPAPTHRRRLGDPRDMDRLRGARVLLAEDHAINRDLAVEILTAAGLAVDVAGDGEAAVARAIVGHYDAVLMDVQMPALDGYEATRRIRAELGSTAPPIIAMTADATPAHQERALAAGMSDHLSKPVDVHALFAKLARWVPATGARPPTPASSMPAAAMPTPLRRSLLERFCDEYRDFAAAFATAQAAPQADATLRLAHTLKGVAGNLGLTDIAQRADALETACRNDGDQLTLNTLATDIHTQIAALDAAGERLTAPATEPAPCCEIPAMDPEDARAFRALAERLQALLDAGDAEALEVAARLVADIDTDSGLGRRLAVLRQRIEEFEFAAAANDLRALKDPLARLGKAGAGEPAIAPTPTTTALTDRLADLLDSDDTDAGTVAEALMQALESRPELAATARQITHRVDEFDYTAARAALAELRRKQAQEADDDRRATHRPDR